MPRMHRPKFMRRNSPPKQQRTVTGQGPANQNLMPTDSDQGSRNSGTSFLSVIPSVFRTGKSRSPSPVTDNPALNLPLAHNAPEASSATLANSDPYHTLPPEPQPNVTISPVFSPPSPISPPTLGPIQGHSQSPPDTVPANTILPAQAPATATSPADTMVPASSHTAHLQVKALEFAKQKLNKKDLPLLEPLVGEWSMQALVEELSTAHNNWGKNSSVAKRMGKILDSVDKYAKIVDIGIQHSPEITSLVWGGIRAILQIARNHSEAIECFEATLAIIVDKMATCNFYASIYTEISPHSTISPGSAILSRSASFTVTEGSSEMQKILNDALPKLWASVIIFSIKAQQYFDAKWSKKAANMVKPFTVEFQPLIDDINNDANVIRECADAATMKRIKDHSIVLADMEGQLNDIKKEMEPLSQLNDISHYTREVLTRVLSTEEEQLLQLLSPLEPLKRHADIRSTRLPHTGTWMLEHETFRSWCTSGAQASTSERILCCYGMPGAGKTFMSSLVIDELENKFHGQPNLSIACVYSDYTDQKNQTAINILGSFIYQLLGSRCLSKIPEEIISTLKDIKQKKKQLEIPQAVQMLKLILQQLSGSFICIDALDELEPANMIQLLQILKIQLQVEMVKVFITGRPHIQNEVKSHLLAESGPCPEIQIVANANDIRQYLDHRITQDAISNSELMSIELKEQILETITARSQGMFLLPALQIDTVLDQPTKRKRNNALKTLPTGLHDTFTIVLDRIKQSKYADLAQQVLMWLHYARRPLRVNELQHALSVERNQEEDQKGFDADNVPPQNRILTSCLGLVIVHDETATVRFVHYSLEEYFREQNNTHFPDGPRILAEICLTYLNFDEIRDLRFTHNYDNSHISNDKAILQQSEEIYPFLNYAALNWMYYAKQHSNQRTDGLALKLLHHGSQHTPFPILVVYVSSMSEVYRYYKWDSRHTELVSGIHLAAWAGLSEIVESLLIKEQALASAESPDGRSVLSYAAGGGHEAVVRLLLERRDIDVNTCSTGDSFWVVGGLTALSYAAGWGHEAVVRLLLERRDIDVNTCSTGTRREAGGRTALSYAAERGREAVVRLLLERGDIDVNTCSTETWGGAGGRTALSYAAEKGREAVVRLLLERGDIDVNTCSTGIMREAGGRTALSYAAGWGHEAVVRLLLERRDIDVNTCSTGDSFGVVGGRTALSYAAGGGHEAVVRLLLERGDIDVNTCSTGDSFGVVGGQTALSYAAGGGHEAVVRLLLERRDIDVKADKNGRTVT